MYLRATFLPVLLLLFVFQSPPDSIRQHSAAADAQRRAGNPAAAEAEYTAILAEAYGRLGKIYSAETQYKEAVVALESAARYRPDSPDVLVDLSIAYFDAGQYQKALEPLGKALSLDARSVGAHHMLGKTHFMLGDFTRSVSELEAALRLAPNDYDIAYTLGLAHLKQHELAPARQIYDQMLARLGDRPQLHIIFGRAYRETSFLPEAIEEFKKAVALDPHFPRAHYYLGLTYLLKDGASRLDDAAAEFKVELDSNPNEFFANYYLGVVCVIQRKWEPAIGYLEKATRIEPDNPDPYFHLGQAYQAVEKHQQAIEVLRKSIALNPELSHNDYQVTTAHYRLGQSLVKAGRKEEGEKELQTAAELKSKSFSRDKQKAEAYLNASDLHETNGKFPEMVSTEGVVAEAGTPDEKTAKDLKSGEDYYRQVVASAHNDIGLLRAERQDFRGAAEQFRLASKWNPRLEGVDFNAGLAAYKAELYKDAIPPLERVLAAAPANAQAKQLLGMSYFLSEDYARASALLSEVVSLKPDNVGLYYTLALSLIKQGKQTEADEVIRQMILKNGNSPQLHIVLGQAYYEQGDTGHALEELKAALALDPRTPLAHYYTGLIHLKDGKFEEAAREFESELALNPADLQAKYHLGFVLLARQESERGIRLMREVVSLKPDFAEARYELGKALLQQGNVREATENLETAARLAPDKSYVHFQLARAYQSAGRKAEGDAQLELYRQLKEKERARTTP
ncbi:MAG TPA: tetratricopeptide repeat protein [Pyrinomonadaceae bacterium]|jgi:tetratricopeptide (TPR) repeat protein|nr:tetratricopeptide repeat protein [Pyrinomonadaceae bacterium]